MFHKTLQSCKFTFTAHLDTEIALVTVSGKSLEYTLVTLINGEYTTLMVTKSLEEAKARFFLEASKMLSILSG